jgi:type I restriction enzyme S subunit
MENYVSGAVLQRIILREFKNFLLVTPPKEIRETWDGLCSTFAGSIWNNNSESETLTKLRDTLLPKLISGELRIPEAEQLTEEAVA